MTRLIGLDLGSKTCGVAISDHTRFIARPLTTIRFETDDYDTCFDEILRVLNEQAVNEVVLGFPKHMNGDIGIRGQLSMDFSKELQKEGIRCHLWDERLTTVSAERVLITGDVSRKKRKKIIDQMAAQEILQSYLDRLKNEK